MIYNSAVMAFTNIGYDDFTNRKNLVIVSSYNNNTGKQICFQVFITVAELQVPILNVKTD